jgi:hypothetical protein
MEFIYDEKRTLKQSLLFIKSITLIFHFFSIYINFNSIEKDNRFIYYLLTLFSTLLCVCNNARYEYVHYKIHGLPFASIDEFIIWKKSQQFIVLTCFLNLFETFIHIFFFCLTITKLSFVDSNILFYSISTLFLEIYAFICFFLSTFIIIFCCSLNISFVDVFFIEDIGNNNKILQYIVDIYPNIDEKSECCICMDKNTNPWVSISCGHKFHRECIMQWNRHNNTCPICRAIVIS